MLQSCTVLSAFICLSQPPVRSGSWLTSSSSFCAQPSVPPVPNYKLSMSIPEWLQAIQTYMKMLQYPLHSVYSCKKG